MTIALDGSATGEFDASSGSVTLTTVNSADEIVVSVQIAGAATVSSVTSSQVAFTQRTRKTNSTSLGLETWYGGWSASGSLVITVALSTSAAFTVEAVGISGLPQGAVWDANASLPKSATGSSTAPNTGSGSTTTTVTFLLASVAAVSGATQNITTQNNVFGSAATARFKNDTGLTAADVFGGLQYRVSITAQSNKASSAVLALSASWAILEDAVAGYTATPPPPPPPSTTVQAAEFAQFPDGVGTATSTLDFPPGQGY